MIRLIFITLLFSFIFYACNTKSIRQNRIRGATVSETKSQPDSFLYYQPKTLPNSFLDSLTSTIDKTVELQLTLLPPPPAPPPKHKQIQGYRIQTFAGLDSLSTLAEMISLKGIVEDSVYFFKENNLYKIQFGDYVNRNTADLRVLDIRKEGITGAWVVQTMVNIPATPDSSITESFVKEERENLPFKIQILVTSDELKAKAAVDKLKTFVIDGCYYRPFNNLFKVYIGNFKDRQKASQSLEIIKANGYPDAWLVY